MGKIEKKHLRDIFLTCEPLGVVELPKTKLTTSWVGWWRRRGGGGGGGGGGGEGIYSILKSEVERNQHIIPFSLKKFLAGHSKFSYKKIIKSISKMSGVTTGGNAQWFP